MNLMHQGLGQRLTAGGLSVMRLHYSADPAKRPGTPAGEAWLARAVLGYPGGRDSARWRKEMEIKYGAMGGMSLFPKWAEWSTNGCIVVPALDSSRMVLYGSYDHGLLHPSSYLVHGIDDQGLAATIWECKAPMVPVKAWCRIINGMSVRLLDGREFQGNPYAGREQWRVADPSMWARDNNQSDGANKRTAQLFEEDTEHPVFFERGMRGGDNTLAEYLHGYWWENPLEPRYRICACCTGLIDEIGKQRFTEISAQALTRKAAPETLVDRDNDSWDALKYWMLRFPPRAQVPKPPPQANTFAWWANHAGRKARHRGRVRSFRFVPR